MQREVRWVRLLASTEVQTYSAEYLPSYCFLCRMLPGSWYPKFIECTYLSIYFLTNVCIGKIYINVSRTQYNIFNKMMDLQTVHVTVNKATVCKNRINCLVSGSDVWSILHPNRVFYLYIDVLLRFSYILGNRLVVLGWHYNAF